MFDGCINLTDIRNIHNLSAYTIEYIFNDCKKLKSIDLSKLDISGTEYLNNMFSKCVSLQNINLNRFKLDSTTTIKSIFNNCYS